VQSQLVMTFSGIISFAKKNVQHYSSHGNEQILIINKNYH